MADLARRPQSNNMNGRFVFVALGFCLTCRPATAAPLQADPVQTFIQLCGETQGNAATAVALADTLGWTQPPKGMPPPPTFAGMPKLSMQYRLETVLGGQLVLQAGTAPGDKGLPMRFCSIAAYPLHSGDRPEFALLRQ